MRDAKQRSLSFSSFYSAKLTDLSQFRVVHGTSSIDRTREVGGHSLSRVDDIFQFDWIPQPDDTYISH